MVFYTEISGGLLKAKLPQFQSVNQDKVVSALKTLESLSRLAPGISEKYERGVRDHEPDHKIFRSR